MLSDIDNVRKLMLLLGDEGFTDALTQAEELVDDANRTLDRVEQIEDDAAQAVREANETLVAVDRRLDKVDETISLLEAKIEAGFSLGFLIFAADAYFADNLFLAAGLAFLGLLGAGQLLVTLRNIPQVEKVSEGIGYVLDAVRGRGSDNTAGQPGPDGRERREGANVQQRREGVDERARRDSADTRARRDPR
ncbi:hypothetical protein BRC89_08320 [Halobacteriales archaeon QS_4_70_19]|nr:MAG: hypothetical protein BRC89_08320 [Halobacteriales archaeon QS_4_70_19]